jgi:uncharacterized membrane protein
MNTDSPVRNDENLLRSERWIAATLRSGVVASVALIVVGLTLSFIHHPAYMRDPAELTRLVTPGAAFPKTLHELADGLGHGEGRAITVLGLLALIATPIMRVAISVLTFIEQKDKRFALITATVFALLILSLVLGHAE